MKAMRSRRKPSKREALTDLSNLIPSSSLPSSQSSTSSSLVKPQTKSSLYLPLESLLNENPNTNLNVNSKIPAIELTANENVNDDDKKKETETDQINKAIPSSLQSPLPETPSGSVYSRRLTAEKRKSKGKDIVKPSNCSLEMSIGDLSDNFNYDKKKESQSNKAKTWSVLSPPPKTPSTPGIVGCMGSEPSTVRNRRHSAEKGKSKGKEIAKPLSCCLETRRPDLRRKKDQDGDINLPKSCPVPRKKKRRQEKAEAYASVQDLPPDFIDKQRAYFAEVDAFELEEEEASANELE